ncbi:DUF4127 family protein [Bacillus timonensis]|uniref:DUF4127 family protein n=1 Tax=Bacillus timonensis TaxID=1033734 RepID=A0A4S3PQL9_9BACI|nr:DUF4127 family protein [Bacillus timonensis]THE11808.1 DUF4127 family protein [Bacillus timonensis]
MKIVYLPLDERPCNLVYPQQLAAATDVNLHVPSREILGNKKTPATYSDIRNWLVQETKDANYLIISLDMLVYGGIVPSRLHKLSVEECQNRLELIKEVKKQNKNLTIFAFNLIMRVPNYNSSDEEPDYYELFGEKISNYGKLVDKEIRGQLTEIEVQKLTELKAEIPLDVLNDFIGRRKINSFINNASIELVEEGLIDSLIIPLDDNAEFGFSSIEQNELVSKVEQLNLFDKIAIYPGADEIGCTLFTKVFCDIHHYTPSIFIRYSSTNGPFIIPKYEDRSLHESIKSHITVMGGIVADNSIEADAILFTHSPSVSQSGVAEPNQAFHERHKSYFSEINYREFVQALRYYVQKGKVIGLADVATCNGSDQTLMNLIKKVGLLEQVHAYAGWNTSGNTLGTVISHTIIESYYKKQSPENEGRKSKSREFYYSRLIEDWGYQTIARKHISINDVTCLGGTYFDISDQLEEIQNLIKEQLTIFIEKNLSDLSEGKIILLHVYSPWKRMFEVGFDMQFNLLGSECSEVGTKADLKEK